MTGSEEMGKKKKDTKSQQCKNSCNPGTLCCKSPKQCEAVSAPGTPPIHRIHKASSEHRAAARPITTDWTEGAVNGTHFWYEYDGSSMCALITPDKDCKSVGSRKPKVKCTACRMVIHDDCRENLSVKCRPTFREASHKKESWTQHHWVLRRKAHSSKCKECHKTLPKGPTWASNRSSKAFVAVSCSWCKDIYHTSCFKLSLIEDHCTLGDFEQIIIPPSWIVFGSKARSGGSKKGSKRKISYSTRPSSSTKRTSLRKRSEHDREENKKPFHIKVPSSATINRADGSFKTPLIVFVNPKSGGNQGVYLIQAFQWLLNPRQVFDLTEGGPTAALQMFQHVPNLRILVCGGDGTVGWVLAEIDRLQFTAFPPVAVLPLGTGNDLARVLNWGGGYADEPLEKILFHVADGAIQALDRWEIAVDNMDSIECAEHQSSSPTTPLSALDELDLCKDEPQEIKQLPISVMNNYFSLGLDAYIQFQFHNSREANPEKFNSRAYNKFTYVKAGFVDTFEQKYKDLSRFLELVCDGEDLTEKIRDQKIHCLVFLNIPSYSAGAYPWGNPHTGIRTQSMDDGFIEVLGLSGAPNMAALQVGIRGVRLCQCRKATVISRKAVHTQVDGEPAYLAPSMICVTRRNQARMIMKGKTTSRYSSNNQESICNLEPSAGEGVQPVKVAVHKVTYYDYNKHNGNITELQEIALPLTMVVVRPSLGIDTVRPYVEKCVKEMKQVSRLPGCVSENWCFLHSSDGRLYPISNDLESQLPVQDMVATGIFVLDIGAKGTPKTVRDGVSDRVIPIDSDDLSNEDDGLSRQGKRMTPPPSSSNANNTEDVLLLELFEASKAGDVDKLKSLHESGADITATNHSGMTALHMACCNDKIDVVRYLVNDMSADNINRACTENCFTPLHYAAQVQSMEMCKVLVDGGALVSLHDNSGKTAMLLATEPTLKEYLQSTEHYQLKCDTGTPV